MAFSLAGVHTVHGRPVFMCAIGVTLPVSWQCCSNHWSTLALGWRQTRQHSMYSHSAVTAYYRYRGLRECHSICCVCISWSLDHGWPLLCTYVLSTPSSVLFIVLTNSTVWEGCYSVWWWSVSRKLSIMCHILYHIFWSFSNKKSHYRELVCKFHFILYVPV
jgi:hypothetical protein